METKERTDDWAVPVHRADGWLNVYAGMGGQYDKSTYTTTADYRILSHQVLTDLWMGDGLGNRVVKVVADDMTRKWINIPGDPDNKIMDELHNLHAKSVFNEALCWMRLYGGSVIVVGYRDGGDLEEPLKEGSIKDIDFLQVYSRDQVFLIETTLIKDPNDPNFGEPEFFNIQPKYGSAFLVHRSRCLVFKGELVPNYAKEDNWNHYWGMSVLQPAWDRLSNMGAAEQGVSNVILEFIVGKYKLDNLGKLLAEGKENQVVERMTLINMGKSLINAVLLGEKEEYTRDTANLGGLADVLDRMMIFVSAVFGIPVTKLFGRSPAGENATGESDMRNYYDMVASAQENKLQRPLQLLVNRIAKLLKIADPIIEFNPLYQPTLKETLEMRKTQAEIDNIYLEKAVLTAEEVFVNRFVDGYSFDTVVEGYEMPEEEPEEKKPVKKTPKKPMEEEEEGTEGGKK
jgi:phage-related protein (TIGR01555 family)